MLYNNNSIQKPFAEDSLDLKKLIKSVGLRT